MTARARVRQLGMAAMVILLFWLVALAISGIPPLHVLATSVDGLTLADYRQDPLQALGMAPLSSEIYSDAYRDALSGPRGVSWVWFSNAAAGPQQAMKPSGPGSSGETSAQPAPGPSSSPTPGPSASGSPAAASSSTPKPTASSASTPGASPSSTPSVSASPAPTPMSTATPTPTVSTPAPTPTPTPTPTVSTPAPTPTPTPAPPVYFASVTLAGITIYVSTTSQTALDQLLQKNGTVVPQYGTAVVRQVAGIPAGYQIVCSTSTYSVWADPSGQAAAKTLCSYLP